MILLILAVLLGFQDSDSGIDLFAVYEDNAEAVDEFYASMTNEQIVSAWLDAQPTSYALPGRDRRQRRREEDADTRQRRDDFESDNRSIRERRIDGRTEVREAKGVAFWGPIGEAVGGAAKWCLIALTVAVIGLLVWNKVSK